MPASCSPTPLVPATLAVDAPAFGPSSWNALYFEPPAGKVVTRPQAALGPAFRPSVAAEEMPPECCEFFARLFRAADLDYRDYRGRALLRRLPACLRALRASSVAEASARIAAQPAVARAALGGVLLGVTEFFRDSAVFAFLESTVLPDLKPASGRPRIWSAACSDGRELYSVATLLARSGRLAECELLGTDCRAEAIQSATQGIFPVDTPGLGGLSGLESETRGGRRIPAGLRAAITWKRADVLAAVEPGPWDIILCRNLAIYLQPAAAGRLWSALVGELAPGGHLVVGKADYPGRDLPLHRVASGIYRKVFS